jgi:4-aminobutyrate aminotransferase-like enzyme/Ser/Thr protein kinase RdoA (MazF antagonist)
LYDFFNRSDLVRPQVSEKEAKVIVSKVFGVVGAARELGSEHDRNFRIDVQDHGCDVSYLLKVDNSKFSDGELSAQDAAMAHLGGAGLRIPSPVAGVDGGSLQHWRSARTGWHRVRLFTFLRGAPLASRNFLPGPVLAEIGEVAARIAERLASLECDGLERSLQWDMRRAPSVIRQLATSLVEKHENRQLVLSATDLASERLGAVSGRLREQPIHGDVTDDNIICSPSPRGWGRPDGIVDFGDLATGWLVGELAVTISSVLSHVPDKPMAFLDVVRAFDSRISLTDSEITALWPLVVLRGAVLVVSGAHQLRLEPENNYALARVETEWRSFQTAMAIGLTEAEAAIRSALGRQRISGSSEPSQTAPLLPWAGTHDYGLIDFSVTSEALNDGHWIVENAEASIASNALQHSPVVVAPYGQYRLTCSGSNASSEPQNLALFLELFIVSGKTVHSPTSGVVTEAERETIRISAPAFDLRIKGVTNDLKQGEFIEKGEFIGYSFPLSEVSYDHVASVRVQCISERGLAAPWFTTHSRAAAWYSLTFDPGPLLSTDFMVTRRELDPATETKRRERHFATAQERYYRSPPQIERGWAEHLIDTTARVYLDMINNVSGIGHSHPRLSTAVYSQMQLLNTNSRFLYRALADINERLIELAPDPELNTVLLVNSGTEAIDLAIRLAQIHTGRDAIIALRESYHGWSMAADAVSTSIFDNPAAAGSRPDWVTIAESPNTYRGKYRGTDAADQYVDGFAEQVERLTRIGKLHAGFICEPLLGNAGGIVLPDGYLNGVYSVVHRHGGLTIADEVQVGYGRLGGHFWGFQQQGVAPDIIAVAKAMGNGYPLGGVITRKDIAESLSEQGQFFSSAGGSPVSSVVGIAVLDVMREEGLQENAATMGSFLTNELRRLMQKHPIIGAVHGMGLYLGVELVRDRNTLEPAREEAAAICERLLELGVILQATSERQNVLKIKPPLCLTKHSAEFFINALDRVLVEGW